MNLILWMAYWIAVVWLANDLADVLMEGRR